MLILKNRSFTTQNFSEALFSQLSSYCCVVQYWAGMMTSCNAAAGGRIIDTDLQAPSVSCLVVQACNSNVQPSSPVRTQQRVVPPIPICNNVGGDWRGGNYAAWILGVNSTLSRSLASQTETKAANQKYI